MLSFEGVELTEIGMPTAFTDRQWGTLTVILKDDESDLRRLLQLNVVLPKSTNLTLGELATVAQSDATATLRAALKFLEKSALPDLLYADAQTAQG